jgi:transcriptional regulator with XRE-family HTH domain
MATVKLQIGPNFIEDVGRILDREGISQNELARAMDMDPAQVSRWFTMNPERRLGMRLDTAIKVEATIKRLVQAKKRVRD